MNDNHYTSFVVLRVNLKNGSYKLTLKKTIIIILFLLNEKYYVYTYLTYNLT